MITLLFVIPPPSPPPSPPPYLGLRQQGIKHNLKYKSNTNLLPRYSDLFSDPNFGVLFIIIVLHITICS